MSRFLVAISTAPGGGFYGVYFRESEEGGFLEVDDTLVVDSDFFYFQSNNEGKPLLSFHDTNVSGSGGGGGVTDHGALAGLGDDDHTQYALADGSRDFTGHVTFQDSARSDGIITAEAFYILSKGEVITDPIELIERVDTPATPLADRVKIFAADEQGISIVKIVNSNGDTHSILRDRISVARNVTGSTINKGTPVYISGSTGNVPEITPAKADSASTMPTWGITDEDITNNSFGEIHLEGILVGIDTSAFSAGDRLFVSADTAGAFTATAPTHPNIEQAIGDVIKSNPSSGIISVSIEALQGNEAGSNRAQWTIGTTKAASIILSASNSTAQRTFTYPDRSGQVALIDALGFYGIYVRESEINGYRDRDDSIVFDSSFFYIQSDGSGKPLVSLSASSTAAAGNDTEIQYNSNGILEGDPNFKWDATQRGIRIVPKPGASDFIEYGDADGTSGFGLQSGQAPTIYNNSVKVIEYFDDSILPKVPIWHKDGTASDPSYSFEVDINTGMFRPGTDQLGFSAGAKEMLRLTEQSTGHDFVSIEDRLGVNLGVGVVPGSTFHIQGDGFFENGKVVAAGFYVDGIGEVLTTAQITFRESEAGGLEQLDDTVVYDSSFFYIQIDGSGNPIVSLHSSPTAGAGGGEVNTASNLGGDEGVFAQKSGVDLEFKGLTAGTNITLSSDATSITISSTASGSGGDPGFYGVVFRESDGSTVMRDDQLNVDSAHFYIIGSSDGKPLLSLTENQTFQRILIDSPVDDSNTSPSFGFVNDPSTGIRSAGIGTISLVAQGLQAVTVANTSVTFNVGTRTVPGSASSPGMSFNADSDTGFFQPSNDEIGLALGGVQRGILTHDKFVVAGGFYSETFGEVSYGDHTAAGGTVTWSESEAGGYSNSGSSVVFDSDFFYLSTDGSGVPIVSLSSTIQKDITLESPTSSEDVTFFHTSRALTITAVKAVLVGSSAPSVTVTVRSSTDRSAAGTANVSAQAVVNTTTAQSLPVATAAIAAGSWVWIETTALSGSVDSVSISMEME